MGRCWDAWELTVVNKNKVTSQIKCLLFVLALLVKLVLPLTLRPGFFFMRHSVGIFPRNLLLSFSGQGKRENSMEGITMCQEYTKTLISIRQQNYFYYTRLYVSTF